MEGPMEERNQAMAKLSIAVTAKIRSGLFVLSALWEQGPGVAERVTEKLRAGLLRDQEPPSFLAQIQGLAQILKAALDQIVELDKRSVDEKQHRAALLAAREHKIVRLGQRVTGVRRLLAGHYIDPDFAGLGLEGRTARESIALLRQSEQVGERLRSDRAEELLGEALFDTPLNLEPYLTEIDVAVAELSEAFDAHQRSRRRVDELAVRKRAAIKTYDNTFVRVARQFEDLCRLGDLDGLADRVRPSLSRRGQTAVEPTAAGEAASGGVSSDPSAGHDDRRKAAGRGVAQADLDDLAVIAGRRGEPTTSHEDSVAELDAESPDDGFAASSPTVRAAVTTRHESSAVGRPP